MHHMSHIATEQKYFTMAILHVLGVWGFYSENWKVCFMYSSEHCGMMFSLGQVSRSFLCFRSDRVVVRLWAPLTGRAAVEVPAQNPNECLRAQGSLHPPKSQTPVPGWPAGAAARAPQSSALHWLLELFSQSALTPVFLNSLFSSLVLWLSMVKTKDSAVQTLSVF